MRCTKCNRPSLPDSEFQLGTSKINPYHQDWCRRCRSRAYFGKRYTTACSVCDEPRKLLPNGKCKACMEASGLRFCKVCREELPLISFYGHQQQCISCKKKPTVSADVP